MKNIKFKKILITALVFCSLSLPANIVLGQEALGIQSGANGTQSNASGQGGITNFKIENPIQANNFEQFLADILSIIVQIGIPIMVMMVIYTGFQYVTARGNAGKIQQAHKMLGNVIIGAFIILGCFTISEALTNTVADLGPITIPNIGN